MRETIIHSSLHRTTHLLGAERELVMTSALASLIISFGAMTLIAFAISTVSWFVSLSFLRKMAKTDPVMSKVYMRHVKQQEFYPSKSPIWRTLEGYKAK